MTALGSSVAPNRCNHDSPAGVLGRLKTYQIVTIPPTLLDSVGLVQKA
jgi:hypothetical protein